MRFIPELIYAIEQFEKELIKLGKKTKVIWQELKLLVYWLILLGKFDELF